MYAVSAVSSVSSVPAMSTAVSSVPAMFGVSAVSSVSAQCFFQKNLQGAKVAIWVGQNIMYHGQTRKVYIFLH